MGQVGREALAWKAGLDKGVGSAFHASKLLDAEGQPKLMSLGSKREDRAVSLTAWHISSSSFLTPQEEKTQKVQNVRKHM